MSPRPTRPIIVLGAARSGTKFLRDALGAGPGTAVVPYDVNFIWRTGNESAPDDALPAESFSEPVARAIRRGLHAAAGVSEGTGSKRLIEKTVSNTVRVPFVARVFPEADFVHIVRDGRPVVESSIRQWNQPTDWRYLLRKARVLPVRNYGYALWYITNRLRRGQRSEGTAGVWGVRYAGIGRDLGRLSIAEICARQWVESVCAVRAAAPTLGRFIEVRYEKLVEEAEVLAHLIDWLGLADKDAILGWYHRNVSKVPALPWDRHMQAGERDAASRIMDPLRNELGYL